MGAIYVHYPPPALRAPCDGCIREASQASTKLSGTLLTVLEVYSPRVPFAEARDAIVTLSVVPAYEPPFLQHGGGGGPEEAAPLGSEDGLLMRTPKVAVLAQDNSLQLLDGYEGVAISTVDPPLRREAGAIQARAARTH